MYSNLSFLSLTLFIVALAAYNMFTKKYSNKAIVVLGVLVIAFRVYYALASNTIFVILDSFIALVIAFLVCYFVFRAKDGGIGGGDMKLILCIGFFVGSIYVIIFLVVARVILLLMGLVYFNNTFREQPRIPTGFVWTLSLLILFVINIYWDSLLGIVG